MDAWEAEPYEPGDELEEVMRTATAKDLPRLIATIRDLLTDRQVQIEEAAELEELLKEARAPQLRLVT